MTQSQILNWELSHSPVQNEAMYAIQARIYASLPLERVGTDAYFETIVAAILVWENSQ